MIVLVLNINRKIKFKIVNKIDTNKYLYQFAFSYFEINILEITF